MTGCLDDVPRVQGTGLARAVFFRAVQDDSPLLLCLVPERRLELCFGPDVQLEEFDVGLEELGQFVFRGEDGPAGWEGEIRHVVEPDWVVQDELVVAAAPAVTNAILVVDDQGVDVKHFEAGRGC